MSHMPNVTLPKSELAIAAYAKLENVASALLFNHALRVFAFGSVVGKKRSLRFDSDMLFVCAMLHHIGLVDDQVTSNARFEIDSANVTKALLEQFKLEPALAAQAWDAVALHTSPEIPEYKSHLALALQIGVEADLYGWHFEEIPEASRQQIIHDFPREDNFSKLLVEIYGTALIRRRDSVFRTPYVDLLERADAKYRRPNLCGRILGSPWSYPR